MKERGKISCGRDYDMMLMRLEFYMIQCKSGVQLWRQWSCFFSEPRSLEHRNVGVSVGGHK